MEDVLQIFCKNNGTAIEANPGSSLIEIYQKSGLTLPYGPTSARVNNVV